MYTEVKRSKTAFCHFSFKRPKDRPGTVLLAVVFSYDKAAEQMIAKRTVEEYLWEDQQYVAAVQSYEYALRSISEFQGRLYEFGIRQIMLVTTNNTLAVWIENPYKNDAYIKHMIRAVEKYRVGAPKEISIGVGLAQVAEHGKADKYCRIDYVVDQCSIEGRKKISGRKIDTETTGAKNIYDIMGKFMTDEPEVGISYYMEKKV